MSNREAPHSGWHAAFNFHQLPELFQPSYSSVDSIKLTFSSLLSPLVVDLVLSDDLLENAVIHFETAVLIGLKARGDPDVVAHIVEGISCVDIVVR